MASNMALCIARRLLSLLIISLAIISSSYLGMHMIDNWRPLTLESATESGYDLPADSRAAAADSLTFVANLLRGDLGEAPMVSGAREYAILLGTIVGVSAPSFLIALLLQQGGILYTRSTGTRLVSMGGFAWDFQHLAMPLIVLSARPVAYLTRASHLALGRILTEDYIRTAYAKGLSQTRVDLGHALRNFAVPFLTAVGVSLRFSLSTLPLVEFILAWPGLGLRILDAIQGRVPVLVVSIASYSVSPSRASAFSWMSPTTSSTSASEPASNVLSIQGFSLSARSSRPFSP